MSAHDLVAALPPLHETAVFLDFDGTLVDLAETPDGIAVPEDLPDLLDRLTEVTGGALALVSGRSVGALEEFLPSFDGVIIGGHGAEQRIDGLLETHPLAGSESLGQLTRAVEALARQHPGTIAERKPTGVVLHYRRVPDLEARLVSRMSDLAATHPGIELHRAKMALELRPDDIGKDIAVGLLRSRQPFDCKKAILFGDDATDEVAMRYLLDHGDLACKVGTGETGAPLRAKDPTELRAALWMWTSGEGSKAWPSKD